MDTEYNSWMHQSPLWLSHIQSLEILQSLLQHHEDAGWIHPSNLSSASPSFLLPKSDSTVLPCWVNNYWVLNSNTVLDLYPLLCGHEVVYQLGDKVMLSTFHRCQDYKCKGDDHAAKFFPRWHRPYMIITALLEASSYTLNNDSAYPYYASELKLYHPNDPQLFPNHKLPKPGPTLTSDGMQEHEIKCILDAQPHGCGYQYLIQWVGYGPEDNKWLPGVAVLVAVPGFLRLQVRFHVHTDIA